jgi:glycosyltransferase 2 family protein
MNNKFSIKSIFIKLIISCCFVWILFSFVQTKELVQVLSRINLFYFSLSFALVPIMVLLSCLKWKLILDLHKKKIPYAELLKIYLIGYMFSNVLPSTFGGDVARSYYSGKIINNQTFSAIAVFIERFSGIMVLLLLVILAPLLHEGLYRNPYIYIPAICALGLIVVIAWVWKVHISAQIFYQIARKSISFLYKITASAPLKLLLPVINTLEKIVLKVFRRLKKLRNEMTNAVSIIRKDNYLMVKILLLTVLFYLSTLLNVYLSFMAFNIQPDFLAICAVVPVILFVGQIPVTFLGNIGFFLSRYSCCISYSSAYRAQKH